jgi:hypothetical protein
VRREILCSQEVGFAYAHREVVYVYKEKRISVWHEKGCMCSSDIMFTVEYMHSKAMCSLFLGTQLHCVTSIVLSCVKRGKFVWCDSTWG